MRRVYIFPGEAVQPSNRMRRILAPGLFCLVALIFSASNAFALDPNKLLTQYMSDMWTTANGLPQNAAFSIVRTHDGYLWFGTLEGLVRFDGLEFKVFNPANTPELPYPNFAALFEDREGTLWAATGGAYSPRAKGNALLRYNDGKFQAYTEKDGYPGTPAYAICGAREGGLWIGTSKGLCRFKDGAFSFYTTKDGLSGNGILCLCEDHEGTLWVGTDHGVNRYRDGKFIVFDRKSPLASWAVKSICEARDGSIWVGSRGGLDRFKDGQDTHYTTKDGLPEDQVMTVFEDTDGNLWIGTEHGDLVRWRDRKFSDSLNLADDPIWSIYEDNEGSLWVGSFTGGLHRLTDGKFTAYTTVEGLLSDSTWGVYEDNDANIWISTSKGLNRIRNGNITSYTKTEGLLESGASKVYQDRKGTIWIGTTAGINRFKDGKLTGFPFSKGDEGYVTAIHEDAAGTLWVGSVRGLFHYSDGSFKHFEASLSYVSAMYEDKDGSLWLGTNIGLFHLKGGKLTWHSAPDASSIDLITSIVPDDSGALWLGTDRAGLLRFKDQQFTRCTSKEGLFDDEIWTILDDTQGNFWMGCSKGVFRVSKRELIDLADGQIKSVNCTSYDTADGMKSRETTDPSTGFRTRDGRLWFSTVKGVAVINPAQVSLNTTVPPVYIKQALADGQATDLTGQLEIRPGTRNVEFSYAGLSLVDPQRVRYRYQLIGFDKDWQEAGTRRVAYYTNLPVGHYQFRVIAANNDGLWNIEGAMIRINVLAPFYQRWWFVVSLVGALAAVALFIFRARVSQLEKKQAAQEAFSRKLIESQEQERKRIAAELHDSLGQNLLIIKNRAMLASIASDDANSATAKKQFDDISVFTAQALEEVRHIAHNLRPYHLDNLGLTKSLEAMIEKIEGSSGIHFDFEIASLDGALPKDWEINVYRIVQEAINNIIKHSAARNGRVEVVRDDRGIVINIRDNGNGFDQRAQAANGGRMGFGLTGMAERVRMLGGVYSVESAPGKGTTVTVKLGLNNRRGNRNEQ